MSPGRRQDHTTAFGCSYNNIKLRQAFRTDHEDSLFLFKALPFQLCPSSLLESHRNPILEWERWRNGIPASCWESQLYPHQHWKTIVVWNTSMLKESLPCHDREKAHGEVKAQKWIYSIGCHSQGLALQVWVAPRAAVWFLKIKCNNTIINISVFWCCLPRVSFTNPLLALQKSLITGHLLQLLSSNNNISPLLPSTSEIASVLGVKLRVFRVFLWNKCTFVTKVFALSYSFCLSLPAYSGPQK